MSASSVPIVAIVGRPNVGKSTLFNRIVGERAAIVEDRARTTRDRLYGETDWNARRFMVVDTGGLEVDPSDPIEARVQDQARIAIAEADVIVFVVEAIAGLTPADLEAAEVLRRAKAPVLVAVNKSDNAKRELEAAEFYALGWEHTYPIAAIHGRGVADLLDEVVLALPPESEAELARKRREDEAEDFSRDVEAGRLEAYVVGEDEDIEGDGLDGVGDEDATAFDEATEGAVDEAAKRWDALMASESGDEQPAIAFVGRPNVGKSSLLNALLKQDRMIVSDVPGTTRDAIDTTIPWGRTEIVLIDTAGIRRRGRVAGGPAAEKYSTLRSFRAISRADVAVLLVDGVDGLTAQDAHIAGFVVEEGRGLVVAVNKWDAVEEKSGSTFDQYVEWIRHEAPFLDFAPVVSISAKTGQRVERVLELAVDVWAERRRRVPTGELNRVVGDATARQEPPMVKGRRPKLFYATQVGVAPPTFVFFARDASSVHFSYRRYLENRLRDEFGFLGTPIRLVFRERATVREPRGRRATGRGSKRGSNGVSKSQARPGAKASAKAGAKAPESSKAGKRQPRKPAR
ncbi:MAG TPA: ribosome biogenesis GTPase Der [Candidatus Limnocylindrales bacterium]|nr:ribosome biogenesis GTPase Der [Candidatus Limnocylindrales bacterium]